MAEKKEFPKDLVELVTFLQSSKSALKTRNGFVNNNRVVYFKGKHAVNAICRSNGYDREKGDTYLQRMLNEQMILKVSKNEKQLSPIVDSKEFNDQDHYVFLFEGSKLWGRLMGFGVLLVVFIGVMFPLWPPFMRQGVYYLSMVMMGLLGCLMGLGVIRLILWLGLVLVLGRGGWLFPNLFADVGVIESFYPLWSWDRKKKVKTN